jgi:DNA-binding protein HU-beta
MNKSELINAIAEKANLTKVQAKGALEAFVAATQDALNKDEKVSLIGFGTFSNVERKARVGHNPANGKKINIPAKKVVKFKPGAGLAK